MNKQNYLWPFFIAGALATGILLGGFIERKISPSNTLDGKSRTKLNKLIDLIENEYVDKIDTDSVINLTLNNILSKLDPHSVYITEDEFAAVTDNMRGSFVGLGLNYNVFNDTMVVIKPTPNGASAKAGIQAGDRILYVDGKKIFGKNLSSDDLGEMLKGEKGSQTNFKVFRKKNNQTFDVKVTRTDIPLKSVDVALMLDNKVGYIKINRFSETTFDEFDKAFAHLLKNHPKALVLDLRDNGGGYMEPAIRIADEFLEKGNIIVKTVNKKGNITINKASENGRFTKGNLFVLINEETASASEIIAGAIQDNDRGTIIGRRSYGKGLVQREMYLGDGSAVRLTTARYYTPSGRSIQKPYNNVEGYNSEIQNRFLTGELYEKDSIHIADSLMFKTKSGRVVYGGGGIVPDIFIPIETKHGQDAIRILTKTTLFSHFVFQEIDKDRSALEKLSLVDLIKHLKSSPKYFTDLKKFLVDNALTFNLDRYKEELVFYMIAEFINQLKTEYEYYYWLSKKDPMIQEVLYQVEN